MATPQAEREARERGDVIRSRSAPLLGALLGAGLSLELFAEAMPARIVAFAKEAYSFHVAPTEAFRRLGGLLVGLLAPIVLGCLAAAFAAGLLQTRAFFGRPGLPGSPERAAPGVSLASLGWLALALLLLMRLREAGLLALAGDPLVMTRAAARLAARLGQGCFVAVIGIAVIDHLLRARARAVRLDAQAGRGSTGEAGS